jgi:galactokinase
MEPELDIRKTKTIINAFARKFSYRPDVVVRAPGRVNLLGAHVDYNEGWVLPGAIDKNVWLAAGPRSDRNARIAALDMDSQITVDLGSLPSVRKNQSKMSRLPRWSKFPLGVAWVLGEDGHPLTGIDAILTGDVPIAAGVSSSAAVEVAFIMAWESLSGLSFSRRERALIGQRVENEFLGVSSGIMDQYASIHGRADNLILLDCRSIDHQLIPLPVSTGIIVADSGVRRELSKSEYNLRREQCQEALSFIQYELPDVRALRDVSIKQFHQISSTLPEVLRMRTEHVVEECARVLEGVQALQKGDLAHFGDVIIRSHMSSRYLYEVSIEKLDVLAEAAWDTPGCYGARLTGAGFGGCVVAYVENEAIQDVSKAMSEAFSNRFGSAPMIFSSRIADGASARSRPDLY